MSIFDLGHTIILRDAYPDIYNCRRDLILQFYYMLLTELKPKDIIHVSTLMIKKALLLSKKAISK
jgi:hypothetical protein